MDPRESRAEVTQILNKAYEQLAEAEEKRITKAELEQQQAIYERQVREEQERLISYLVNFGREVKADE
jgi:hypothetical protein